MNIFKNLKKYKKKIALEDRSSQVSYSDLGNYLKNFKKKLKAEN